MSSAGGECAPTSDVPCRDVLRAFRRAARRQDRLPRRLVKGCGSERPETPSIDECPHRPAAPFGTTTLEREPATGARAWPPLTRLPTLFRRPAPERGWLDRGRFRALFTPGRTWPRAARRLLQSKRSASTTSDLETRLVWRPLDFHRAPLPRSRSAFDGAATGFPTTIPSTRSREVTGQGPFHRESASVTTPLRGLLHGDGSLRRLNPNPIGSNTSCRATRVDYDRSTVIDHRTRPRASE